MNIGEPRRTIYIEPIEEPESWPVHEPSPAEEPSEPAPREPTPADHPG
jgi:hypothetical protein